MDYPKKITVVEVGPRDGFQMVKDWIETEDKIKICKMLLDAGVEALECTSFISPKAIPQMADAKEVAEELLKIPGADEKLYALVGNRKGVDRAVEAGIKKITMVISASPEHNKRNVNRTPEESLAELKQTVIDYPNIHIKLDLATAFGCPFLGEVTLDQIFYVLDGAVEYGIKDICLCDTIGVALPDQVGRIMDAVKKRYEGKDILFSVHLHNTRGLAMASTIAALDSGITRFETAVNGLGGCPFAPGASGNMATEDLIYFTNHSNIETGIDIDKIIEISGFMAKNNGLNGDKKINSVTINTVFNNN